MKCGVEDHLQFLLCKNCTDEIVENQLYIWIFQAIIHSLLLHLEMLFWHVLVKSLEALDHALALAR